MNINIGEIRSVILPARPVKPKLKIVPWATGTDEEITAICNALDVGTITIADTGWQVGDERVVHLTAQAGSTINDQDVIMTLLHEGQPNGISRVDGLPIHFMTGLKEPGRFAARMYASSSYDVPNWWGETEARMFCNGDYKNSLPSTFVGIFKQMIVQSKYTFVDYHGSSGRWNEMRPTQDYFAIPAIYELIGETIYDSTPENGVLERWDYYQDISRIWKNAFCGTRTSYFDGGTVTKGKAANHYGTWLLDTEVLDPPNYIQLTPFGCF